MAWVDVDGEEICVDLECGETISFCMKDKYDNKDVFIRYKDSEDVFVCQSDSGDSFFQGDVWCPEGMIYYYVGEDIKACRPDFAICDAGLSEEVICDTDNLFNIEPSGWWNYQSECFRILELSSDSLLRDDACCLTASVLITKLVN